MAPQRIKCWWADGNLSGFQELFLLSFVPDLRIPYEFFTKINQQRHHFRGQMRGFVHYYHDLTLLRLLSLELVIPIAFVKHAVTTIV